MNIILVHGILGFRSKFGLDYFRGVAEHLRAKGLRVLAPTLDPTRGIIFRGNQLRDQINLAMANGDLDPAQKSHIIAHSMGGLDSRWMIDNLLLPPSFPWLAKYDQIVGRVANL
jgi:triacylglycerol lipase